MSDEQDRPLARTGGAGDRFRAVIDQSPFSTVVFRPDGSVLFANAAFARMWSVDEAGMVELVSTYNILADPELEAKGLMPYIECGFAGESVAIPEVEYQGQQGRDLAGGAVKPRWVRAHMYPVRDAEGAIRELVLIHEDVTERVKAERERVRIADQLVQQQKLEALGRLASGIAHDFNNLLMVIGGQADLARSEPRDGHAVRAALDEIRRATGRGAALVRQLMAVGRRREDAAVARVELAGAVDETVRLVERIIGEDVRMVVRHEARGVYVQLGAVSLQQILMNLCLNARDAMPEGGTLVVETGRSADGGRATLRVSDTGIGMPPEVAERAFEAFFTTKAPDRGTGLGLATVKGIVTAHGGSASVRSSPGHGTTVTLELPEAEAVPASPPSPALADVRGGGELVLVVEDERMVRVVVERTLTRAGYRTLLAETGDEGLERYLERAGELGAAVLDVVLPGMSGARLLERIRETRPELPVVLCSGYTADVDLGPHRDDPAVSMLAKPFSPAQLLQEVGRLLAEARSARA